MFLFFFQGFFFIKWSSFTIQLLNPDGFEVLLTDSLCNMKNKATDAPTAASTSDTKQQPKSTVKA